MKQTINTNDLHWNIIQIDNIIFTHVKLTYLTYSSHTGVYHFPVIDVFNSCLSEEKQNIIASILGVFIWTTYKVGLWKEMESISYGAIFCLAKKDEI